MIKKLLIVSVAALVAACQGSPDEKAATLLEEARGALEMKNIDEARALVDSLRRTYPTAIEARKKALVFTDSLEMTAAALEFAETDSVLTFKNFELDELKKEFVLEKDAKYQSVGYYVVPTQTAEKMHRTTLRAEVNEEGQMVLISILHGKKLKHNRIRVTDVSGEHAETPQCFSFLTHNVNGYEEEASYKLEEDGGVTKFIAKSAGGIEVTYIGNESLTQKLSSADKAAIRQCLSLAKKFKEVKEAKEKRDKLDMKIKFYERKIEEDGAKTK